MAIAVKFIKQHNYGIMQSPDLNKMAYHRTEADRLIRINREQLNIPEEQTALAIARDQGREEILAAALKEKAKGGIFRRDGRALIDILDEVCIDTDTNTPAEEKLLLDEHSIRSWLGKKKQDTPDGWVKYWSKIKVIARDFPAESLHPGASELAVLASCAHSQGKYWALQDILFANQDQIPAKLTEVDMKNLLGQAGVDLMQVQKCLIGSQVKTEINRDYATGFKYGVRGTPTFFINGQKIEGVISLEAWEKFLGGL